MVRRRLVFLCLILVLTACQPAAPAPVGPAYPAPAGGSQAAYPAPAQDKAAAVQAAPADRNPVYPGIKDGETIQWIQAESMAYNGEVAKFVLGADLSVTVTLKDGRSFITTLPSAGYEKTFLQNCGDACMKIEVVSN